MYLSRSLAGVLFSTLALIGCSGGRSSTDGLGTTIVQMPDGRKIRAEVLYHQADLVRGMKFRDSLPLGQGMLFVYGRPGLYTYWTYEVRVPLDIVWLDRNRNVVQLVHEVPPCPGPKETCRSYGGQFQAMYVLEIPGGTAKSYGLRPGATLKF